MISSLILSLSSAPLAAQDGLGPVTQLPLPRFVSLKSGEANVRRGPGTDHRVDWVYVQRGTPLLITAEYENWRRVQDQDGAGGWIHFTLLTGVRTVVVVEPRIPLRADPDDNARIVAYAEKGVIGWIEKCRLEWCEITTEDGNGSYDGWLQKTGIWGVGAQEILE